MKQVWMSCVKDEFDLGHLIQTRAEFSHTIAVMDRIGGWIEEVSDEDGGAEHWRRAYGSFQRQSSAKDKITWKLSGHRDEFFLEAINWVCASLQDNHDWISEFSLVLQDNKIMEALSYDIEVSCVVHWELLWYALQFEQRFSERWCHPRNGQQGDWPSKPPSSFFPHRHKRQSTYFEGTKD